jgi:hypothetical protein
MKPDRLNALTDGVVTIAITIMVLEICVRAEPTLAALAPVAALLGTYLALCFQRHRVASARQPHERQIHVEEGLAEDGTPTA